jgi:hypothetical protein
VGPFFWEMLPADRYYWPLYFGGIYHKQNLSENWFYYADLAFTIHKSDTIDYNFNYERKFVAVNNYFLYLHNDINWYPFNNKASPQNKNYTQFWNYGIIDT